MDLQGLIFDLETTREALCKASRLRVEAERTMRACIEAFGEMEMDPVAGEIAAIRSGAVAAYDAARRTERHLELELIQAAKAVTAASAAAR